MPATPAWPPRSAPRLFVEQELNEGTEVALDGPAAILIGPEGGFSDEENAAIRACPQAVPVSLGPRILRADTAAVAAVSLWMAGRGDWG